jgi:hypothetical protein
MSHPELEQKIPPEDGPIWNNIGWGDSGYRPQTVNRITHFLHHTGAENSVGKDRYKETA